MTARAGTAVTISATATDAVGVKSVRFSVDGTTFSTVFDPPYRTVLAVPRGLLAGTRLHVDARAVDFSGLQTLASKDIDIVATGEGVVTGKVIDDGTGLPISGANIALVGTDTRGVSYTADDGVRRPRSLRHSCDRRCGHGVDHEGWLVGERSRRAVKPQAGVELVDARLTAAAAGVSIAALSGGVVKGDRLTFLRVWRREVSAVEDPSLTNTGAWRS